MCDKKMPNADKYTRTDAKQVLREICRELRNYKNNVDLSKSENNYYYGTVSSSNECLNKIDGRVKEIMGDRVVQSQTKVIGSWVVSLPKEFNNESDNIKKDFFDTVYDFFKNRYGSDNIMLAMVHNDETQPHMHMCFVPEAVSRKNGKRTVSIASVFTRTELSMCQHDLDNVCFERYGRRRLICNGETKGGVSLEKLKAETAKEQAVKAEKQVAEAEERLQELQQENDRLLQENTDLFTENNELKEENYIIRRKNTNYQLERFRNSYKNRERALFADKLSDGVGIAEKARKLDEIANLPRKSKQSRQERYTEQAEQIIGKPSLPSDFSPVY